MKGPPMRDRDLQEFYARHEAWHQERAKLSWAEKLRLVEAAMPGIRALRKSGATRAPESTRAAEGEDPKAE